MIPEFLLVSIASLLAAVLFQQRTIDRLNADKTTYPINWDDTEMTDE